MDDKFLLRIESLLKNIKTSILQDKDLRKLLYYSSEEIKTSLDSMKNVDIAKVKDNIYLQTVVNQDTTPPFNKGNFITISIVNGGLSTNNDVVTYALRIQVIANKNDWIYSDGCNRPLQLAQKVINSIHGVKFGVSNPIYFVKLLEQLITDDEYGYALLFSVVDGVNDDNTQF